jgi:ribonuclease J
VKLKIHRGAKQIGGNIVEISSEKAGIILDCGKTLPPLGEKAEDDSIDIPGLTSGKSAYDAVFLTHYHSDHCGLANRVNSDIPIYAGIETKTVLSIVADFIGEPKPRIDNILDPRNRLAIGDISITPIPVKHSAAGAMMFCMDCDGRRLLYTGDFNNIDEEDLRLSTQRGAIDVMLCEGTNVGAKNAQTEEDIEREATRIMRETAGQVFVLCSTTNIDRIRSIERACLASGRTMAIDNFMKALIGRIEYPWTADPVGFVPGYIDEKKALPHKYFMEEIAFFHNAEAISKMKNLTFMVRPSMTSFLTKLDGLTPLKDSVLIYSMWKGYENHGMVGEFLKLCRSLGIRVEYLHTSGHAYRETLESTVKSLNPRILVPIHTEKADLFSGLHKNVVTLADGETLDLGIERNEYKR